MNFVYDVPASRVVFGVGRIRQVPDEVELLGADGLAYDDWSMRRAGSSDWARNAAYRYLRSRANSIEGGTSEILRNIIAERVLRMPKEPSVDTGKPFRDVPRNTVS